MYGVILTKSTSLPRQAPEACAQRRQSSYVFCPCFVVSLYASQMQNLDSIDLKALLVNLY
jgi:hypothetical protein